MCYRNARSEADGRDPRKELEEFVLANTPFINRDSIRDTAPNLRTIDEEYSLREFVRTNNPYYVLQNCFTPGRLHILAKEAFNINPDEGLEGR